MKGTQSKEVDRLYRGILQYFEDIGTLNITVEDVAIIQKFKNDHGIICDDSLDEAVIALNDRFALADTVSEKNAIVEEAISILTVSA